MVSLLRINEKSNFSKDIFKYALNWAMLIQYYLEKGYLLSEVAMGTSEKVVTDIDACVCRLMAVENLEKTWWYGEKLREWYRSSLL